VPPIVLLTLILVLSTVENAIAAMPLMQDQFTHPIKGIAASHAQAIHLSTVVLETD
jgi:hypothetical protein